MSKSGKKYETRQDELQPENPEFENTGQYLRKLRTEKGLTIKDVSNATRISEVNLNAIEAQDFQTLPADTFTRGFLTLYAKFLGVDPVRIVQQFMKERDAGKTGHKRPRPVKQPRKLLTPKTLAEPSHFSSMTAAVILLVIIVVLFTAFCLYTSWNPFSFMVSGKKKSFHSLMTGLEQSFPYSSPDSPGKPLPDKTGEDVKDTSPGEEGQKYTPSPSGERIEKNTGASRTEPLSQTDTADSASNTGGQQPPYLPGKIKGSEALSHSEGLQNLQGDE